MDTKNFKSTIGLKIRPCMDVSGTAKLEGQ